MDTVSVEHGAQAPVERAEEPNPSDDQAPVGDPAATDGDYGKAGLYILSFSNPDPEIRASIVGDWTPPEETPDERAARLEECRRITAEYDAEFGPLAPEEKAWADAILDELGIGVNDRPSRRYSGEHRQH